MLSVVLGVTSRPRQLGCRSARLFGRMTPPTAPIPRALFTIAENSDIRSRVRHARLSAGRPAPKALGVDATIVEGTLPSHENDVQGSLMTGVAAFEWKASGSTIFPGAICEHFTSLGGVMTRSGDARRRCRSSFATGRPGQRHRDRALHIADKFPAPCSRSTMPAAAPWPRRSISRSRARTSC